jgi:hypothetical protein
LIFIDRTAVFPSEDSYASVRIVFFFVFSTYIFPLYFLPLTLFVPLTLRISPLSFSILGYIYRSSAYFVMADGYASVHDFRWENDPAFGIVHPSGCGICRQYMTHVATAATDTKNHPTFKSALEVRDSAYNTQFLNGVVEGRRLQCDHDIDQLYQLKACRAERDEAVDEIQNLSAQLHVSQEELNVVKQQFYALQILFEEMAEVNSPEPVWEERAPFMSEGECENSQPLAFEFRLPTPTDTMASSSSSEIIDMSPPSTTISSQPDNDLQGQPAGSISGTIDMSPPPSPILSQPDNDLPGRLPVPPPPAVSVCTTTQIQPSDLATPTTVLQMKSLMNDGCKPGKTEALTKVRTLYTRAQLTPRRQQNDLQQFLLSRWKGPKPGSISSDMTEYTLRRNREPLGTEEVFVDSSPSWGIGFMMNGRWLAWKLKDGWQSGGKDNHWAELVAVELGLRVAIASGSHSGPLVIRSDNVGVVHSLMTGKEKDSQRMAILRNIQELGHTYNVQVTAKWIPTKENPADGPSRGVFLSRSLLSPSPPPLPAHLARSLESPVDFNSLSF